ncbi:eukaryotic translation initiation factor 1A domain containing [Elysia marginata]|uniref:Probable RNA-binding protein EIF1AD n=1 Tax=Elysia marginata TaxID=1093978 RepID=A0AAV4JYH9_9GAST|nr:eukaryotic translation initiation factor 1A domain containing [Elysia marginata]
MSATTKKKHVTKEVLEEYPLPDGNKEVVKVTAARGNNLHEVISSSGETFLVSMPSKFRKHVWIKRGDFIMVEPIEEGDKVRGEITHILFKDQIKHIQENDLWPAAFADKTEVSSGNSMIPEDMLPPSDDDDSDTEDLADLVVNMNRVQVSRLESDSEDSCSEEEEEEETDRVETAVRFDDNSTTHEENRKSLRNDDKMNLGYNEIVRPGIISSLNPSFPQARASPSLPFPSPVFRRLVPRPASPPPLLLASDSGLAQPSLPFVTSVVLRYSVPHPQHTRTSCLKLRPSLDLPWSSHNPRQLATGPTPLSHTAEAHTQLSKQVQTSIVT